MSSTFDTLQQAVALLAGDDYVKAQLQFTIDRLHDYDHKHEGVLNKFAGMAASRLEEAMKAAAPVRPQACLCCQERGRDCQPGCGCFDPKNLRDGEERA